MPIPGGGNLEMRRAESYAPMNGVFETSYKLEFVPRSGFMAAEAPAIEVFCDFLFRAESNGEGLFCAWTWNVDGKDAKVEAIELPKLGNIGRGKDVSLTASRTILNTRRRGKLRAYLFDRGLSVRGTAALDDTFTELKGALDDLDLDRAAALVRQIGPNGHCPQYLLEQMARNGNVELLAALLVGTDAKRAKRRDGESLLLAAVAADRPECVDLLLRLGADANATDRHGNTALYLATSAGAYEVMASLLASKADLNRRQNAYRRQTPLQLAVRCGDAAAFRLLDGAGARWPDRDEVEIALTTAVENGSTDLVAACLRHGARINLLPGQFPYISGQLPYLSYAAQCGREEMVVFLLSAGADLHGRGSTGRTALMKAARNGVDTTVDLLLKAGASLQDVDNHNLSAAAWALIGRHRELAKRLLAESPALPAPTCALMLNEAVLAGYGDVAEALCARGAELNLQAGDLDDVLNELVRSANLPLIEKALKQGLDVNRKMYGAWNIAGLAKRYEAAQVTADLERMGLKLEPVEPVVEDLKLEKIRWPLWTALDEENEDIRTAGATVGVFVNADGHVRAPALMSATNEKMGRLALGMAPAWEYNELTDKKRPWRKTVIPFVYPDDKLPKAKLPDEWSVAVRPVLISPRLAVAAGHEAVWVRYRVTRWGEVKSPVVICATATDQLAATALTKLGAWRFSPATMSELDTTACSMEAVISMPDGSYIEIGKPLPIDPPTTVDLQLPKLVRSGAGSAGRPGRLTAAKNGVVIARYVVDATGHPTNVEIVSASDPGLGAQVMKLCGDSRFEPGLREGKPVPCPMVQAWIARKSPPDTADN